LGNFRPFMIYFTHFSTAQIDLGDMGLHLAAGGAPA
jgi:hypothetical protein